MAWLYLIAASVFEILFVIALKHSFGFTRLVPSIITAVLGAASLYLLAQAAKVLPIGTAYAMWTGIGSVGGALAGMVLFGESREFGRLVCLALIVVGLVGLKLVTATE